MWVASMGVMAGRCQLARSRPGNLPVGGSVSQAPEVTQRLGLEALPTLSCAQSKVSVRYIGRPPEVGIHPPDSTGSAFPLEKGPRPSLDLMPYNTQHTALCTVGAQLVFEG